MFGDHEAISTVWPLVSHLHSMVSFYRYLFQRLLCSLCEIVNPCAAARFAVGSADRLLAVYLVQFVRLAAKRLVGKSLQLRKKYAGLLLNSIKHAKAIQLEAKSDFGNGCRTRSTEPYFYEAAYLYVRDSLSMWMGKESVWLLEPTLRVTQQPDAGTNRCPQGVPKMSQIRSVGSGNVLHNANTDCI